MSAKRYIIHYDARGEEEHPKGDFVHWPDYQALASQFAEIDTHRRKVIAENERLLNSFIEKDRQLAEARAVEALRAKVEEIRVRVEKTICPTFSSDSGDIGEQGRISREDFDTLVISALGRAS